MDTLTVTITQAQHPEQLDHIRALFEEYYAYIGAKVCFDAFEEELDALPSPYVPPEGRLLLLEVEGQPAGCGVVARLGEGFCELRRMFVRPDYQGMGYGRRLAETLIQEARHLGYDGVRLHTLRKLARARALYGSLGFQDIAPYDDKAVEEIVYMELALVR